MVNFLQNLRIKNKLFVLLLVPLLGLLIFPANTILEKWRKAEQSHQFHALIGLNSNINDLINKLQLERTRAVLIATRASNPDVHARNTKLYNDAINQTTTSYNQLTTYLTSNSKILPENIEEKSFNVTRDIQNLNVFRDYNKTTDINYEEAIDKYNKHVFRLFEVMETIKTYGINSYNFNLLDLNIILTKLQNNSSLLRGRISLALQNDELTSENKNRIVDIINESKTYIKTLNFRDDVALQQYKSILNNESFIKSNIILDKIVTTPPGKNLQSSLNISQQSWFNLSSDRIDLFYNTSRQIQASLQAKSLLMASSYNTEFYGTLIFIISLLCLLMYLASICINTLTRSVDLLKQGAMRVLNKDYTSEVPVVSKDELGTLATTFNDMVRDLKIYTANSQEEIWTKNGIAGLRQIFQESQDAYSISSGALNFIAHYLNCQIGLMYIVNQEGSYDLLASYAFENRKHFLNTLDEGKSLIGQAILEKKTICFNDLPQDYIKISSGLGHISPKYLFISPLIYKGEVLGAIELGSMVEFNAVQKELMKEVTTYIATTLTFAFNRDRTNELLEETTRQARELEQQQQELESNNEELKHQSVQLEEANQTLNDEKNKIAKNNERLQKFQYELERKNKDLENANKYKSEFLANMSHELRTPLNSLLIFAQLLSENKEKNLNADQIESSKMIYKSGKDLLNLITDILDLSKAEAGKLNINVSTFALDDLLKDLTDNFNVIAQEKGITFNIIKSHNIIKDLHSDPQRIVQILRNLLSNAFKFTETGSVTLKISMIGTDIEFVVKDTGIGISNDKLQEIFNAFQQADGSITRKYGGTGLGLNISRKMATILDGSLLVQSQLGIGSTFILRVPCQNQEKSKALTLEGLEELARKREETREQSPSLISEDSKKTTSMNSVTITDDTETISIYDRSILVIEDDINFSKILVDMIHKNNYKALIAKSGQAGFEIAKKYLPSAIILDVNLPDINGISVLQMLKAENKTNNIPVHILSAIDLENNPFIDHEAIGYLRKPVSLDDITNTISNIERSIKNQIKNILVVEDDPGSCKALEMLLTQKRMHVSFAKNGSVAKEMLTSNRYDCVILDLTLPDTTGLDLLEELNKNHTIRLPALIVYTGKSLSRDEYNNLSKYTSSIVIKGEKSSERLLDELSLFLTSLDEEEKLHNKNPSTEPQTTSNQKTKTILLVDDDMRNNLALSKVLSLEGINILLADNGKTALEQLQKHIKIHLIVMDIMMPEMDGYQAIEHIRTLAEYKDTPIIALTANAMPGTKEKCLSVGASDYLTKPIEINELLSLINLHLYDQRAAS